ncbi:hypothetical protein GYMLUDRAFT_59322 [Collybiopsis luxurians FD-317 M1]|uniref:CCHC-type domain-containing protein n=1 Tax=Collybiopsis luxurians FD-317 M1 TaxID=944289 RepID=A0A0D0BB34_9AGAR|nr:hypothetical protein GYMLUDRAFT_59322 [Collybiopsis luxurians FD-317 M1]
MSLSTPFQVDPVAISSSIKEEYDRVQWEKSRSRKGKDNGDKEDESLSVTPYSHNYSKGQKKRVCWKCGKEGHFKNKCPVKDTQLKNGGKPGNKPSGSAQVAEVSDSDSEFGGAFGILSTAESENGSMPPL